MTALVHLTKFAQDRLTVTAPRQGLHEITGDILAWVEGQTVTARLLTLYLRHTSASLLIQENYDLDVLRDLEDFFAAEAPEDTALYRHEAEGADDMPAHIKGALTQTHLAVPICDGELLLGRYQGIFLFEHRRTPRAREIVLHFEGQGGRSTHLPLGEKARR
jgi:secondary thiamine-phosphate synthase enzyme